MMLAGWAPRRSFWCIAAWVGLIACLAPAWLSAAETPLVTAADLESGFSIEGQWLFRAGDDPAWAAKDLAPQNWLLHDLPRRWPQDGYPEHNQMGWYRLTLQLEPHALEDPSFTNGLGLRLGKIMGAYEVYANGRKLGGVGKLPPLSSYDYDREKVHFVPRELVDTDGNLTIALRIWGGTDSMARNWGSGPFSGTYRLGDYPTQLLNGIASNVPSLVVAALIFGVGVYHLYLYQRNRQLKLYLWFGLTAVNIAIYSLMLTQWKYMLPLSFQTLKTIEFGAVYLLPALILQMLWALLGTRVSPWARLYQASFAAFAFIGVANPWPDARPFSLSIFQVWVLPMMIFAPRMIWNSMRAGNSEARTLFFGLLVFAATCLNDLLIGILRIDSPRMIHFGFAVVMVAMSVSLGNRFTAMLNRLEREVDERTHALQQANRKLAEAARVDPLTGVLNRRGFIEDAEREIQRVSRGAQSFAIVLADLDHFKSVNDRFGHSSGDKVLQVVTRVLQQRLREVDRHGRWGGEEFILLLPETASAGAAVVADSLRRAIEESQFGIDNQESIGITMTFGIAIHRAGEKLESTIQRADSALYHGKKAGRNQVMIGKTPGLSVLG